MGLAGFEGDLAREYCEIVNGVDVCMEASFQYDIPIQFTENIMCYSNEKVTKIQNLSYCYSTIELLETHKFNITYIKFTEDGSEYERQYTTKTYFAKEYETALSPNAVQSIDLKKCTESFDNQTQNYEYECDYEGVKAKVDLTTAPEELLIIVEMKTSQINIMTIVYIIIGLVIISLVYKLIKK